MKRWVVVLAVSGADRQAGFIVRSWVLDDEAEAKRAAEAIREGIRSNDWVVDVSPLIEARDGNQVIDHFAAVKRIWGDVVTGIDEVSPRVFRFRYEE